MILTLLSQVEFTYLNKKVDLSLILQTTQKVYELEKSFSAKINQF